MNQPVTANRRRPRASAVAIATVYGLLCHIAFIGAVGAMMIVLFSGMMWGLGRVSAPWCYVADALLLLQFPLLHTFLLSRRGGQLLRRLAPGDLGAPMMTTTYALIASLQTGLLFLGWTPIGPVLWQAHGIALVPFVIAYATAWFLLGKAILDAGFALQTGLLGWRAVVRDQPPLYPPMPVHGLFRWIRQPIYVSFALTTWTVPAITPDGLAVAIVLTGYCLIGPLFKEARFAKRYGAPFTAYRAATPYWLPRRKR